MSDIAIQVNGTDYRFPRITFGMRRRYPELADALRRISEIERKYNLLEAEAVRLREERDELFNRWTDRIKDADDQDYIDRLRDKVTAMDKEIAALSTSHRNEDGRFQDAVLDFVFHALKVNHPELELDSFCDSIELEDLLSIYAEGYVTQKKTIERTPTPAEAFISKAWIQRIPEETLRELAPSLLGVKSLSVSDSVTVKSKDAEAMNELKEIYASGI